MNAILDILAFVISTIVVVGLLVVGLAFLLSGALPRSTRNAIQHAMWHRIICGSHPNAPSIGGIIKALVFSIVLLYIVMLLMAE